MALASSLPTFGIMFRDNPMVSTFAAAARTFLRGMKINPYETRTRRRQNVAGRETAGISERKAAIYVEASRGDIPTIVVGGFVPNSTEAVEFQRELLKLHGSIYYMNYAQAGFSVEMFCAQLGDLIEDLNRRGERPVLFGVSFGCGLIRSFFSSRHNDTSLRVKGLVMVSPVLCKEDLIRPQEKSSGGVRMIEIILRKIIAVDPAKHDEVKKQVERARKCFQALFETGAANRILSSRHLSIRKRVMEAVGKTPAEGGYERVVALTDFPALPSSGMIFGGPSLILLSETENELLAPSSPTLAALARPDVRRDLFPRGKVTVVSSSSPNDPVPHASLIFHHHCYNHHIEKWYDRHNQKVMLAVA